MGVIKTVLCRSVRFGFVPIVSLGVGFCLGQNYGSSVPNIGSELTKFYNAKMNKIAEKKTEEDVQLTKKTETETAAAPATATAVVQ